MGTWTTLNILWHEQEEYIIITYYPRPVNNQVRKSKFYTRLFRFN